MTLFIEEMLISDVCISGLMPNLIKKYWTVSNNRPFECEKCEAKYKSKPALEYHISTFHEGKKPKHRNKQIKEKNFTCDQCGYKAERNDYILKHIAAVHEGLRPFPCHICGKTFSQRG